MNREMRGWVGVSRELAGRLPYKLSRDRTEATLNTKPVKRTTYNFTVKQRMVRTPPSKKYTAKGNRGMGRVYVPSVRT